MDLRYSLHFITSRLKNEFDAAREETEKFIKKSTKKMMDNKLSKILNNLKSKKMKNR